MLQDILATMGLLSLLVMGITQTIKVQLGLKGKVVFFVSLAVGAVLGLLFAAGGLAEFKALRHLPDTISGPVMGLLSGLWGSGNKDVVTGWGANMAQARARADAQVRGADGPTNPADYLPDAASDLPDASLSDVAWPPTAATENPNWRLEAQNGWNPDWRRE